MTSIRFALALGIVAVAGLLSGSARGQQAGVVYEGKEGPGKGKHIVLLAGDEEYRSEESMPQLAKILSTHHGFKCTLLLATNKQTGEVEPTTLDNIPGLEALKTADLMIMFLRFRDLPDEQMKQIMDYTNSGRPIIALRTSTHPFNFKDKNGTYAKWSYNAKGETAGGYGRQVFGETWISHYGLHQKESTRGLIAPGMESSPLVRGCQDIWGPSDVYGLTTLLGDCKPVILGQVLTGMNPADPPNAAKKLTPVAWTKTYTGSEGKAARVFVTTMGHNGDFLSEGFRRLMVNATYWAVGMENAIPEKAKVDFVGKYAPTPIGFGKFTKGVKPADLK